MPTQVITLIVVGAIMFLVIGGLAFLSHYYTLDGIKSKTVGDGQHGTARWATKHPLDVMRRMAKEIWVTLGIEKHDPRYINEEGILLMALS